jgi:hypothetical protein
MPSLEETTNLNYDIEKELGSHFDNEYEIGIEFVDELIPYSTEYFVGVSHDSEEFADYMQERAMEQEKSKNKKSKN